MKSVREPAKDLYTPMYADTMTQPLCSRQWLRHLCVVAIVAIPIAIAVPQLAIAANLSRDDMTTATAWNSRTEESEDCEWLGLCE